MRVKGHITEEQIIDYLLGNVNEEEKGTYQAHLNSCEDCRQVCLSWNEMLQVQEALSPSTMVKQRLDVEIEKERFTKKRRDPRKALVIASSVAAAILLLVGLITMPKQTIHTQNQSEDQLIHAIQNQPDTDRLEITPVSNEQNLTGNVWINETNNKMVLEVNGLTDTGSYDHQLWIVYQNEDVHGNVLTVKDGFTKLLWTDSQIDQWSTIKASLEPVGGSETPTGPNTFFVDLVNR
ncbi:anti-sigma factor [Aquibacillus koreensis]|uniref:Anti-sigma factor n=1 Tax=Aquibacillus koreensis TaxID=279446 RepID=A0A9X3WNB2_9BACI|nr:anti-sigma factor [Aquibacillus koreensis]MCT2534451.1 anti-sigma factor [Aquibacillus koreensis]MDC3421758.1 anti-sigma factor [Aquibacillus koreensis]